MRTLILALVMIASTAFTSTPASAGTCNPYVGCPVTQVFINSPEKVERSERARIGVRVRTSGNYSPKGRVTVKVIRNDGGFTWKDSKKNRGKKVLFRTPALEKRGKYTVFVRFDAKPGSAAKDSDNTVSFRVTRRG